MTEATKTTRVQKDMDPETPHARRVPEIEGKPDGLRHHAKNAEDRQEALIDEGIEESFPASDPVSAKRIT